MNDKTILLIGGGALLFLVMSKQARAVQLANTGGRPQPGTNYATPTKTAAAVAGAVNGILNWLSGTPAQASTNTDVGVISVGQGGGSQIDSLDGIWDNAMASIGNVFGNGFSLGNDGSLTGTNPQNGTQVGLQTPSLASFFNYNLGLQ